MKKKIIYLISIFILFTLVITGCSGRIKRSSSSVASGVTQLEVIVPSSYFITGKTMPVVIENHGNTTVNNISYSFVNNYAGLLERDLVGKCARIQPHSSCRIDLPIGTDIKPASAQVQATAGGLNFLSNMVGFVPLPNNTHSGADGITLYGDSLLVSNGDGFNNTMVTAYVGKYATKGKSNESYNHIVLTDAYGNENPYCYQTSGPDNTQFSEGDTLTFYCSFPDNITTVELAPQIQWRNFTNTKLQSVSLNSGNSSTITFFETGAVQLIMRTKGTTNKEGNIVQQPKQVTLDPTTPSSPITITNNGDAPITVGDVKTSLPDVLNIKEDNCSSKTLAPNETCSYIVELADKTVPSTGKDNITVTKSGESVTSYSDSNVVVNYAGESPVVGVQLSVDNQAFINTTASSSMTQTVTVVNSSELPVTPQVPVVPDSSITIKSPSIGNDCYSGSSINAGQSCSFDLVYNNNTGAQDSGSFNLELPFKYQESGIDTNYTTSLHVSYITNKFVQFIVTDSNAAPVTALAFSKIHNDNAESSIQVISLYNQGNIAAQNVIYSIDNTSNNLFTILDNKCSTTIAAGSKCDITISFGPTIDANNDYSANLISSYVSELESTPQQIKILLSGTVVNVGTALLEGSVTSSTASGSGIVTDPFKVTQGTNTPVITYTLSNVSNSSAESVNIDLAPDGWAITEDTCSNVTLDPNKSCDVKLTIEDTTTVGTKSLDLRDITVSWLATNPPTPVATNIPTPDNSPIPVVNPTPGQGSTSHRIKDEQTGKVFVAVLPQPTPTPTAAPTASVSPVPGVSPAPVYSPTPSPTPTNITANYGPINNSCQTTWPSNVSNEFYSVIENLPTSNSVVSIWTKNDLHWDSMGWCDGANDPNSPLVINPGETKIYCGTNNQWGDRIWSDTPRLQHEWWFQPVNQGWRQSYSEQWMTYKNYMAGGDGWQILVKIVANDDWNNAYNYTPYSSNVCWDNIPGQTNGVTPTLSTFLIYTIINDHQMTVSCHRYYNLIYSTRVGYDILRNNIKEYKNTYNTCANEDGSLKVIGY